MRPVLIIGLPKIGKKTLAERLVLASPEAHRVSIPSTLAAARTEMEIWSRDFSSTLRIYPGFPHPDVWVRGPDEYWDPRFSALDAALVEYGVSIIYIYPPDLIKYTRRTVVSRDQFHWIRRLHARYGFFAKITSARVYRLASPEGSYPMLSIDLATAFSVLESIP